MPFIWLSKAELDQRDRELRDQVRQCEAMMEDWYDKFRRLYARLSKRVSDAQTLDDRADGPAPEDAGDDRARAAAPGGRGVPSPQPLKRGLRGF
jgi:hypothetical protein